MKVSEIYKESAIHDLIGGILALLSGILYLFALMALPILGIEKAAGWLWDIVLLMIIFGGSLWGFIGYFKEKKTQREIEKIEAEKEKQQLLNSAH